MGADLVFDSEISIIETDSFGRVLYTYKESYFRNGVSFCSLLIVQKNDDGYVYYYEDFNFISKEGRNSEFNAEEIELLKERNDWNEELNLEKCAQKIITNDKQPSWQKQDMFEEMFPMYKSVFFCFLTSDAYGRDIYYGHVSPSFDSESDIRFFVILFDVDSSHYILEIEKESLYDYQEELAAFKKAHSWNIAIE